MEHTRNLPDTPISGSKIFGRRAFLKGCAATALLAGLPLDIDSMLAEARLTGIEVDHLLMTWTGDPSTSQSIAWRAKDASNPGALQYVRSDRFRITGWTHARRIAAKIDMVESENGPIVVHRTLLDGLQPGTAYTFRAGNGREWSDSFTFKTEAFDDRPFNFLVFGDSQSGQVDNPEYGPWRKTVNNAFRAAPDAKFMINVGDLVEEGQNRLHWENWFAAASDVLKRIPNMAVVGNHETYITLGNRHTVMPTCFSTQIGLPQNGPHPLKGQVYSFDYGNVHFAVLDSQQEEEGQYVPDMLSMQAEWLDRDLEATYKKWKLVFFHKTPYYNKANRTNEALKATLLPVIDRHGVDIVFNGHDHGYSRTWPIRNDTFVDSPKKGTIYVVTGRSGNKSYPDLTRKVWTSFFHDPQDEPNYIVVKVGRDLLTVSAFTQGGRLIDRYTIDKARGTDHPATVLPERTIETRLVVWGNMLQEHLVKAPPSIIAGTWHVPLRPFFEFVGGTVKPLDSRRLEVFYSKKAMSFALGSTDAVVDGLRTSLSMPIAEINGEAMLSIGDIETLAGFSGRYHENLNMLFVTR